MKRGYISKEEEQEIMKMRLNGCSFGEIAKKLDRGVRAVQVKWQEMFREEKKKMVQRMENQQAEEVVNTPEKYEMPSVPDVVSIPTVQVKEEVQAETPMESVSTSASTEVYTSTPTKTLEDFTNEEIILYMYKQGYRIRDNKLVQKKWVPVPVSSILNKAKAAE